MRELKGIPALDFGMNHCIDKGYIMHMVDEKKEAFLRPLPLPNILNFLICTFYLWIQQGVCR